VLWLTELNDNKGIIKDKSMIITLRTYFLHPKKSF